MRRTQYAFSVHGARSLLIAKFVPGFSTAAPPLAGIIRKPFLRFVVVTGLGGLITGSAVVRGDAGVPGWPLDRAPYLLETSLPGVFAAGDVRCRAPKGVAAAVGEGAIALRSVREYLSEE